MFNQFYKQQFSLPEPNTFIGNLANLYPDAISLASIFGLNENDIKNYSIKNNNIKCYISSDYQPPLSWLKGSECTYFIDFQGRIKDLLNPNAQQPFQKASFTFLYYLPKLVACNSFEFRSSLKVNPKILVAPNLLNLGQDVQQQNTFANNNCTFYANKKLKTINNGSLEGDLSELLSNGGKVIYKDLDSINQTTKPPKATNLNAINVGGTYVELGFTQPSHVNVLKYALVFVNGFFQDIYDVNNVIVNGLAQQTEYEIKIILADKYFNLSEYSNIIKETTN